MRHQYEISSLVSQTSFREETIGGITKRRLYYQARARVGNRTRFSLEFSGQL